LRVKEGVSRRKEEASSVTYLRIGSPEFIGKDGGKTTIKLRVSAGIQSLDKLGIYRTIILEWQTFGFR
jgi:hypothetical protein